MTHKTVSISLLKKIYHIKCDEQEVVALETVSRYLDNTMRQIKQKGPNEFSDIAVLAALNIGNELYQHAQKPAEEETKAPDLNAMMRHVQERLRETLGIQTNHERSET